MSEHPALSEGELLLGALDVLEDRHITIHQQRCVKVRNRHASCRRCLDVCPADAISIKDNTVSIDTSACLDCGICATVCPTTVFEAQRPSDSGLLQQAHRILHITEGTTVFACAPLFQASDGYDPALVVELGCLGRLEESVLIALTVLGAEHIMLAHADCAACPLKRGRTLANTVFATVDTLLAAWGHANPLALTDAIPEVAVMTGMDEGAVTVTAGSGLSRRDFFTQIRTDAQSTVVQTVSNSVLFSEVTPIPEKPAVVKVMQDGTLPHFIPNRRERLLDYLDRLGEVQAPSIDTRLWGTLSIDETLCNSCRMCATFCPTGAIVKYDDPVSSDDHAVETKGSETTYSIGVEHYCADCVECRLCEDICPTKAAHISSLLSTKSLVEGRIVRIPMKPQDYEYNTPDQIYRGMFDLLGGGQIYEYGGANTRPR